MPIALLTAVVSGLKIPWNDKIDFKIQSKLTKYGASDIVVNKIIIFAFLIYLANVRMGNW
jgi:hypothetical protein